MIPSCSVFVADAGIHVHLSNETIADTSNVLNASITYQIKNDGTVHFQQESHDFSIENWITDPTSVGAYECRAVLVSGDTPNRGATLNSWHPGDDAGGSSWGLSTGIPAKTLSCVLTVQIRDVATSTVRAQATITMTATNT